MTIHTFAALIGVMYLDTRQSDWSAAEYGRSTVGQQSPPRAVTVLSASANRHHSRRTRVRENTHHLTGTASRARERFRSEAMGPTFQQPMSVGS